MRATPTVVDRELVGPDQAHAERAALRDELRDHAASAPEPLAAGNLVWRIPRSSARPGRRAEPIGQPVQGLAQVPISALLSPVAAPTFDCASATRAPPSDHRKARYPDSSSRTTGRAGPGLATSRNPAARNVDSGPWNSSADEVAPFTATSTG